MLAWDLHFVTRSNFHSHRPIHFSSPPDFLLLNCGTALAFALAFAPALALALALALDFNLQHHDVRAVAPNPRFSRLSCPDTGTRGAGAGAGAGVNA